MKIKEVKTKSSKSQLNELQLSSLLGDYGAAQQSQAFGRGGGRTKQDIMTQNIFIKNFVSNAISNLQTAIKGGVVDPNKKVIPKASDKDFAPQSKPTVATQGDIGDFDLKDKMAKQKADQEKVRKDQEIANVSNQRLARAAASPTSPEASAAVDARMQRAAQAQQAQTPAPASVDDRLERAAAQQGKKTSTPQLPKARGAGELQESNYAYLNLLFEAIIETVAVPDEDTTVYSIEQYLKNVWFPNYMKGVDISANDAKINQIIKQVADTYSKDGGRAALTQLANLSYAISPRKSKPEPKKPESDSDKAAGAGDQSAEKSEEIPTVTIGKDKYTKGKRGWANDKKELVSATMAQMLDQLYAKQSQNPAPATPATPAAQPAVPKATDADFAPPASDNKTVQLNPQAPKKTGTYNESKTNKSKVRK